MLNMINNYIKKILDYIQKKITRLQNVILKSYEINLILESKKKMIRDEFYHSLSRDIFLYHIRYPDKIIELKQDLDQESQNLIDLILQRVEYIYSHNIMDRSKLLTRKEIEDFGKVKKFMVDLQKSNKYHLKEFDMTVFYYKHGLIYVPDNIVKNLINKDIIDGGAYIGDSALMFENNLEKTKIHSFEPNDTVYKELLKTIRLNKLKRVYPNKMALSSKEEVVSLKDHGIASYISDQGEIKAKTSTIDFFSEKNTLNVGLIKLDIEGYGLEAIKGASNTIKNNKPILLISIYHNGEEFFELKNYVKKLNPDYNFIIRKLGAPRAFFDTTLIAWVNNNINT